MIVQYIHMLSIFMCKMIQIMDFNTVVGVMTYHEPTATQL